MSPKPQSKRTSRDIGPALVTDSEARSPCEPSGSESTLHPTTAKLRRPGPNGCRRYIKRRLAQALPEIADRLVNDACKGSLPAVRALVQMSGLEDEKPVRAPVRPRGRTIEEKLMEDWRKETLEERELYRKP